MYYSHYNAALSVQGGFIIIFLSSTAGHGHRFDFFETKVPETFSPRVENILCETDDDPATPFPFIRCGPGKSKSFVQTGFSADTYKSNRFVTHDARTRTSNDVTLVVHDPVFSVDPRYVLISLPTNHVYSYKLPKYSKLISGRCELSTNILQRVFNFFFYDAFKY